MKQYFDKDYDLRLKLDFYFHDESEDNYNIITQSRIFEYLSQAEKNQNGFITQTKFIQYEPNNKGRNKFIPLNPELKASSYSFSIDCKRSDFSEIFDSILDVLVEDFEGDLMLSLKCDISFELFMEYENGASVKITKEQLHKHRTIFAGNISLESNSSQEYHEIEDNQYIFLCFTTQNENNNALKKLGDSWGILFSEWYSNCQKIEYHTIQETNQLALVISIREDIAKSGELYLDLLAFVRVHRNFFIGNNIEANWISLHRFYSSGEIAAEKIAELNANLIIIKSYTEIFPPFEEIFKLL